MNQTPKIDTDFITVYENKIDSNYIINLIELVNKESYPFGYVMRRPHLTMELPIVHHEKDNHAAIELRHTFNNILHGSLIDFLKRKNINKMKQVMNIDLNNNYILVSKMVVGTPPMSPHIDLPVGSLLTDSFVVGCYVNDDFDDGEIYFPERNFTYKPQSGDVAYYKRNELHGVNAITKGKRYTLTSGFIGPID